MDNIETYLQKVLPEIKITPPRNELDYYGFSKHLATKLGLPYVPDASVTCRHGLLQGDLQHPEEVIMSPNEAIHLVSNKKECLFLKEHGIYNVHAIGLPFIYIDVADYPEVHRYKNSLLVMPPHSLPKTTHKWEEEHYIEEILEIASDFDSIVFCIHQNCEEQGLWVNSLKHYGISWVLGAEASDENSLVRMAKLFSSFEYMTTNNMGSHVAYASYCGCKVSLFGKYPQFNNDVFKDVPYYQRHPHILDLALYKISEIYVRKYYSFLFSNPKDAICHKAWSEVAMGFKKRYSLKNLAELIGWTQNFQLLNNPKKAFHFSHSLNIFYNAINNLKEKNKKYIIYGASVAGLMMADLLDNKCVIIVDLNAIALSKKYNKKIATPDSLVHFDYDEIIIAVLGREEKIRLFLMDKYGIHKEKIINIDFH